jgi:hypothetical protein
VKPPPEASPPTAIVAERDRLISEPNFMRATRPLLDRLSNTAIWIQLNRRRPIIARAQLIEWSLMEEMPDEKWSDRDIALQVVFHNSFFLAVLGGEAITAAEKKRRVDSYRERARRLREDAVGLREDAALFQGMGMWSVADNHSRAIARAAAWCEAEAEEMISDLSHLLVSRHQGPPHVRAYCIRLARVTRVIYGDVLRGIVANIATAALDHPVSPANVRYWCENKRA